MDTVFVIQVARLLEIKKLTSLVRPVGATLHMALQRDELFSTCSEKRVVSLVA